MTSTHPFSNWKAAQAHERGKLARAALSLHPTTGDLMHAYFEHGLHETPEGMKSLEEIQHDLQSVVAVHQIRRYLKNYRPELSDRLGEPR